ncbi:MAG: universal stress protein [Calditrichaeota bacterium]|nr:MAG: universal stress protein [Calditrichota bacterium]
MFNPKKILVPTDFSEGEDRRSVYALRQAIEIASQFNAELIILHVISENVSHMPLFFLDDEKLAGLQDKLKEHSEHELQKLKEKYVSDDIKVSYKIRQGSAYHEILEEEKESKVDLIVISSRGHSHLTEFFYGSTTEKVVRRATCSVLVVRNINERDGN